MGRSTVALAALTTAVSEAGTKIRTAAREIARREAVASTWVQRFIVSEIETRTRTRGPAYWDEVFPGVPVAERAERRIGRMLTRATVAGVAGAAGASTAEVVSVVTDGVAAAAVIPLGFVSVGAELLYTTALQIDLAFDLASIYGVPFAHDDVGEISTLLAMALGVDLIEEPSLHDKPGTPGETKPWRVVRQMQRSDFAKQVSKQLLKQSILRNALPVVSVLVSAAWHQLVLRRFARHVHTAMRQRLAIVSACRELELGGVAQARCILDGAWLIATADGDIGRREALALSTLIDSLALPDRIGVQDASFSDDEEGWFLRLPSLEPAAQGVLMEVLVLIASADGELDRPERRFLRRVARALGREIDLERVELMVQRLRIGDSLRPSAGSAELARGLSPTLAAVGAG